MVALFFAAVAGAAVGHEGWTSHGSKNRGFLAAVDRMRPSVAAHSLSHVEGQWQSEVLQFTECNADSHHGDCKKTQKAFEKSCGTIVTAVVAASSGDRETVKEYMGVVCAEQELKGWKQNSCKQFAKSITDTMTTDSWVNREQLDVSGLCVRLWTSMAASETSRLIKEHEEERVEESKHAKLVTTAAVAEEASRKVAAEEAARKAAKKEAARKAAAAEAEAAAEERRKQAEEQQRQIEEQQRINEVVKAVEEVKQAAKTRAATKKAAAKKKATKTATAKKTVKNKKKAATTRAAVNKRAVPTNRAGVTKQTAAAVKPAVTIAAAKVTKAPATVKAAATNTDTKKTVAVQERDEHAQAVSHAAEMDSAEEEEDEVDKELRKAEQEEEETRRNIAQAQAQSKADHKHHATSHKHHATSKTSGEAATLARASVAAY